MRLQGYTYEEIADKLGYADSSGAYRAVKRAKEQVKDAAVENAEEILRMELDRLDRMQRGLWKEAIEGSPGAVDRILKIMERRAKLLGLDAPDAVDLSVGSDYEQALSAILAVLEDHPEARGAALQALAEITTDQEALPAPPVKTVIDPDGEPEMEGVVIEMVEDFEDDEDAVGE